MLEQEWDALFQFNLDFLSIDLHRLKYRASAEMKRKTQHLHHLFGESCRIGTAHA